MPVTLQTTPQPQQPASPQPVITQRNDYQPLKLLKLPGVEISPKGLILVVGPNSSGKTQLLKDIHALLSGEQRKTVVCEQIEVDKPADLNRFVDDLVEQGYLRRFRDAHGHDLVSPTAPLLGFGPAKVGDTRFSQVQNAFTSLKAGPFTTHNNQSAPFFNTLGHSLVDRPFYFDG